MRVLLHKIISLGVIESNTRLAYPCNISRNNKALYKTPTKRMERTENEGEPPRPSFGVSVEKEPQVSLGGVQVCLLLRKKRHVRGQDIYVITQGVLAFCVHVKIPLQPLAS